MAGENFFQWAGRNIGEYVSGQEGFIPGRDTAGKTATQLSGGDADWIPGVSVAGGDRNPTSGFIGPTATPQSTSNPKPNPTPPTGETPQQQAQRIAAQQEAQRKAQLANQYGITAGGYKTAAQTSLRDLGNTYEDSINQLVNDYTSGQTDINSKSAQN